MQPYPEAPINNGRNFCKTVHTDTYPAIDPATKSDHTGHHVLITGASKGVGRATAISFAKAGAAGIAVAARSDFNTLENEILSAAKSAGKSAPKVLKLQMDVLSYESITAAAKQITKEFGKLDILINNAGYLSSFETLAEADMGEWWKNYEVNLRGVAWVSKLLLPLMLKEGEKTIVNVSSLGAHSIAEGASGYQGSKFALLRFTEALMADHGMKGLLAYTVHPCGALTELASAMPARMSFVFTDKIEIASDTMCFLTQERREWLAGRFVSCPWDMTEFLSREKEIVEADMLKMRMVW
ncbi:Citrinin synthesis mpl6 [Hyphodiscus hymeniophilus]|uniref:Citrinin synthesis mpl6 n=1 Tax=Hyphodiscus hymeniophilus TaxID=353542 RepID=A0A9P6VEY4_9HELO|nr:Citrinin synthesis mpl6 [Hyphodiscus hymeniophilus]